MGLKNKIWSTFFEEKNQSDNQNQTGQGINHNSDNNNNFNGMNNTFFQSNRSENQQNQGSYSNQQPYILPTRQVMQKNNSTFSTQNNNDNANNFAPVSSSVGDNINNNQVPQYYNHNLYYPQPNNNYANYNNNNNIANNMPDFNYKQANQLPNINQNAFLPQQNQVKYDIYGNYIGANSQNNHMINNQPIPFEQLNVFDYHQQNVNNMTKPNHNLVNNNINNNITSVPIVYNGFDSFNKQNHDFNNQPFHNFSQYPNHNNNIVHNNNNNNLLNHQQNQLPNHNIDNVKSHNEKFSKKLYKHQLRNYQMPNEIASEIKSEKIRSFLILMFGFIGTVATVLFITLYFVAKNQGLFEGNASDIAKNAIVGISVNSLPHPFITFTLLIVSLGMLFGGTIDLLKVKKEANLYLANLIRGNNTIPYFIIENYKKMAVRSIILNWVAFPAYILGAIVLLILYGFQKHAGESFTVGFWKWGVVKDLTTEITINIVILIAMLAIHILNIVSTKNRKSNIIGYYGYEIVSPDEMRQIKKRVNRNCLIVFIIIVMIILIAITIPLMISRRKKESRWVWPWQARR